MKNFSFIDSEPTEITEIKERRSPDRPDHETQASRLSNRFQGWILYDGDCRYCIAAAKQFKQLFAGRGFYFIPLQTPSVQERLDLQPGAPLEEMRVLTRENRNLGGADAVIFLAGRIWWSSPLELVAKLPGVRGVLDRAYRWIAAHRGCTHFAGRDALCRVPLISGTRRSSSLPSRILPWIGLFVLPVLTLLTRSHVAPWIFMWLMAGAIFSGCKWLTFRRARQHVDSGLARSLGYLFAWAGMDAASFLGSHRSRGNMSLRTRRIFLTVTKILLGALFIFGLARLASNQLLAGWIGMIGMILILHFGLFDLAAMAWRIAGINAQPIMHAPIRATSLSEFWGRRWNGAFNQLVVDVLFRRLARSIGIVRATFTAFLLSGLIHELVISLPAGAGYGLPTAYFLLQGWGVVTQRSTVGNRLKLRRGISGRIFTMLIAAGPAFWLFHPPFVRNVILPFMKAIGAL
jgi:predicted DCC family thiol-disulfide oxidoreductase YuxK